MLTFDSLNSAVPLATVLDSKNLIFVPIVGTPLEKLVSATRSDTQFAVQSENSEYVPDLGAMEYIAN
ncbi:MAG: hypothetical protein ACD_84C00041G0004, partial [uncultured bacterium]